jgi:uncharacterized repeat protein (TIGR03943 family)
VTAEAGGAVSLLTGVIAVRLALTGDYKRYVRPGMGPLLALAGVAMVLLGLTVVVRSLRRRPDWVAEEEEHQPERIGWLLLVPVLAVLLVAPPALGAFAVSRTATVRVETGQLFSPLPASATPHAMPIVELLQRAGDRDGASMAGTAVGLTGFVAGSRPEGFELARYSISCCAADAAAAVVSVATDGPAPSRDQWVTVTGVYRHGTADQPVVDATKVVEVAPPDDPYEG